MATWRMCMNGVLAAVNASLPALNPPILAAVGWPSRQAIQAVAARQAGTPAAIVSVYERGGESRDVSRWNRVRVQENINAPAVQVQPAAATLAPRASFIAALLYTPAANDAIALSALSGPLGGGVTALASAGMSAAQLAAALAAAVNADPLLGTMLQATASGASITLKNISQRPAALSFGSGNLVNLLTEVGRKERRVQVTVWAATESALELASDPLESGLQDLSSSFGVQLKDNTWMRLKLSGDLHRLDGIKEDTYRRDFFVAAEYGITVADTAYTVLAALPAYEGAYDEFGFNPSLLLVDTTPSGLAAGSGGLVI